MTVDIYQPDQWHDFFITVGGAAAALTGLVFVAMSLFINLSRHGLDRLGHCWSSPANLRLAC